MLSNRGEKFLFLLFFVAFSAFSFELLLTRVFSILMWYHFASLSIGLAMLGLGGGGLFSYLAKDRLNENLIKNICLLYLTTLLVIHLAFFYVNRHPDELVPFLSYFHQPYFQPFQRGLFYSVTPKMIVAIVVGYLLLMMPFFLAGVIIAGIFKLFHKDAQKLYFADMSGAAFGSVFVALALNLLSPMSMLSLFVLIGVVFLLLNRVFKWHVYLLAIIAIILLVSGVFYKKDELPIARGKVARDIIWADWNAFSRVILYPLKGEERANPFGQSPYYNGYVPEQWGLLVDDTGYTTVSEEPTSDEMREFFKWNLISLPYLLRKDSTLIIGPGGGKDINCARAMGVNEKDITAVELNPLVIKAVNDVLEKKTNRLYDKVNTHVKEGRSFLEKDTKQYGVLQATSVYGRIPPASGIFTFAEDNLYTIEAFYTYISRLKDGGMLALSRFIYEQTVPKMIVLSINALKEHGFSNPEKSIFLAKERGLAILLVKKGVFTKEEINLLLNFSEEKGFSVLYDPYGNYENLYSNIIKSPSEWQRIEMPRDDKPFYYYNFSKKEFLTSMFSVNDRFEEKGISVLKFFLYLSMFFVILIIILPLLLKAPNDKRNNSLSLGIYFFCLGIGYIMIEIIFIKSFSLFLETPIYSMIFVTGSMLFSSALGAYFSKSWLSYKSLRKVYLVLLLLILLMIFVERIINLYLYLPIFLKVLLAIAVLSILGFFLGMPFSYILKSVGKKDENLVAWGIALNSVSSVLGSFLCLMFVVNLGFKNSFLISGVFYLVAFLMLFLIEKKYEEN